MASTPPPSNGRSSIRPKYPPDDPRSKPSSASPTAQATFMRRLGRIRASQPGVSRPGRISRGSAVTSNVVIPFILLYSIFLVDWGPQEHVFSGPQRWLKRQKDAFWSLPSDEKPAHDPSDQLLRNV